MNVATRFGRRLLSIHRAGTGRWPRLWAALLFAALGCDTPGWSGIDTLTGSPLRLVPTESGTYSLGGIYRSARLGTLRLWQVGPHVRGRFVTGAGASRIFGVLDGTLRYDLLRYRWLERRGDCLGPRSAHGHGFFFFLPAARAQPFARLIGQRDYLVPSARPAHLPQLGTRIDGTISALQLTSAPDSNAPAADGCGDG
jgi:hypothetical protein